jgi:transposase InsO family protein
VRVDEGPELTADAFVDWCLAQRIALGHTKRGKPDQTAFMERFNRTHSPGLAIVWLNEPGRVVLGYADHTAREAPCQSPFPHHSSSTR